ncbi:MAG: hypothetical protein ACK5QX_08715 [bacterium]
MSHLLPLRTITITPSRSRPGWWHARIELMESPMSVTSTEREANDLGALMLAVCNLVMNQQHEIDRLDAQRKMRGGT